MGLSIAFILYNLINLPFRRAYHNYRANICHIAQLITLFVSMYYQSMRLSNVENKELAYVFSPAKVELYSLLIVFAVSFIVLAYELVLYLKGMFKCKGKEEEDDPV